MHLLWAQQKMKPQVDGSKHDEEIDIGDSVFVKLKLYRQQSLAKHKSDKLAASFYYPFTVVQLVGEVAYKLELPKSAFIYLVFHVSQLCRACGFTSSSPVLPPLNSDFERIVEPD